MYHAMGACTVEGHCMWTCEFFFLLGTLQAKSLPVVACDNMVAYYDCMLDMGMAPRIEERNDSR